MSHDARDLSWMKASSVQCAVFSPPYWGLRRYGDDPLEIGVGSLAEYLDDMRMVFQELQRATTESAVVWCNIGDTFSGSGGAGGDHDRGNSKDSIAKYRQGKSNVPAGQRCLVPQRLALLVQEDGWFVRQVITWDKGKPVEVPDEDYPEPFIFGDDSYVKPEDPAHTKRPGLQSETILMLTKQRSGYKYYPGQAVEKGDVWHFPPYRGKRHHPAPFPDELPRRCILLSTDLGDTVFDPFGGLGTTARVAAELGRKGIAVDLYEESK